MRLRNVVRRAVCGLAIAGLTMSAAPSFAQMSPAQLKAQTDRAAREAAARAEAQRQRKAAAARESQAARAQEIAEARRRTLKADAERRTLAQKIEARNQAVASGKISVGYMIGSWVFADPSACILSDGDDFTIGFDDDGTYFSYNRAGSWSIADDRLVWDYTDINDNKIQEEELVSGVTLNSFVIEETGGHQIWFRCPEGEGNDLAIAREEQNLAARTAREEKFERDTGPKQVDQSSHEREIREYAKGLELWEAQSFASSKDVFEGYMRTYPWGYSRSYVRNFLGIFYRYHEVNLPKAAGWFLQNYQLDPGGERAADSLLSLAEVMKQLGDEPRYCLVLKKFLNDYTFEAQYRLEPRFTKISKLATCQ